MSTSSESDPSEDAQSALREVPLGYEPAGPVDSGLSGVPHREIQMALKIERLETENQLLQDALRTRDEQIEDSRRLEESYKNLLDEQQRKHLQHVMSLERELEELHEQTEGLMADVLSGLNDTRTRFRRKRKEMD